MKALISLAVLALILGMSACKDGKINPARTMDINILSPVNGSQYDKDDTVWMKASVNSNQKIEVISLRVNKVSNDSLLYTKQVNTDLTSLNITEYFINQLNPHADLVMTVQTKDGGGNETGKKQVYFHCHAH